MPLGRESNTLSRILGGEPSIASSDKDLEPKTGLEAERSLTAKHRRLMQMEEQAI
jgi:hypothetical protein